MRWRLSLKEYGPEIIYIKGSTNIVADALSRLNLKVEDENVNVKIFVKIREANALLYGMEKQNAATDNVSGSTFPLTFKHIHKVQRSDDKLLGVLKSRDEYSLKIFRGGGKQLNYCL